MKTDLSHLPKDKQEEIRGITDTIRETVEPEMIILFGSHARGDWVEDHETGYMSDYDVLVIVRPRDAPGGTNRLGDVAEREVNRALRGCHVNAIGHSLDYVNGKLGEGQYFFSDIVREGILLFDSGRHELAEARELDGAERAWIARRDFKQWFKGACDFYDAFGFLFGRESRNIAAFELHQATERFYTTLLLVFTNYKPRTHDIEKLGHLASPRVPEVGRVFPRSTAEEEKRFDLLKRAYVDARYDPDYMITRDELEYLAGRVRELRAIVEAACRKRIDDFTS